MICFSKYRNDESFLSKYKIAFGKWTTSLVEKNIIKKSQVLDLSWKKKKKQKSNYLWLHGHNIHWHLSEQSYIPI